MKTLGVPLDRQGHHLLSCSGHKVLAITEQKEKIVWTTLAPTKSANITFSTFAQFAQFAKNTNKALSLGFSRLFVFCDNFTFLKKKFELNG